MNRRTTRFLFGVLAAVVTASALVWSAQAHFNLSTNLRIIHIEQADDGLVISMRLPLSLVLADGYDFATPDPDAAPAPFTYNRPEDGQLLHYFDTAAFNQNPDALGALVLDGHRIRSGAQDLTGTLQKIRVLPASSQTRFTTPQEVAQSMAASPQFGGAAGTEVYVGSLVVDIQAFYTVDDVSDPLTITGLLTPKLEGIDQLANLVVDHRGGESLSLRTAGTLNSGFVVSDTASSDGTTISVPGFVWQGMLHIWEGIDHVLFVLCLTVGALGLGNLLWRITGFTLGHTVTLIAGFLGLAPSGEWFVPTIEAAIALSIVYAGFVALSRKAAGATFIVTCAIGLLHGFGFSFVLGNILQVESPNLIASLLAFNVGVEIGQVAIILIIWPIMIGLGRISAEIGRWARAGIVVPCIALAAYWTVERVALLWPALSV